MLWKTCELNCEKTCELFNFTCFFTCFSHLFHRVWNCWDPVKRAVFTGSEPMQNPVKNPVSFYPVKKPVKDPVKNLLKTCELSHCFSHGRKCQNLWKGHFSQGQNPCKTLWKTLWIFTLLKTCERPCEKPVNFYSVFHRVQNVKTCEQGIFHRVRTCEKPSEMGGVYLAAACCQRSPLHSPNKKLMLKSDFCPQVTGNLNTCI